jgi:hypothetical protein
MHDEPARVDPTPDQPLPNLSDDALDPGVQESGQRGIARDERLKRTVRQHPQRDIPRTEDVEPSASPPKYRVRSDEVQILAMWHTSRGNAPAI